MARKKARAHGQRGIWGLYHRTEDDLWCGWIAVGRHADGTLKRAWTYSKDEGMCLAAVMRLLSARGMTPTGDAPLLVGDLLKRYRADREAVLGATSRGYEGVELSIRVHLLPRIGGERLNSLTPGMVERMMVAIARENATPYTALRAREFLRAAWNWGRRERLVTGDNPASLAKTSVVDYVPKPKTALSLEQARTIIAQAHPLRSLWITALFTAMRVSELCSLRWEDLDLDGAVVHVPGTKTPGSRADVLLAPCVVSALQSHMIKTRRIGGNVWLREGERVYTRWAIRDRWAAHLRHLGITPVISLYEGTRHSAATIMRAEGVPLEIVQSVLRHAHMSTTERYAHADVLREQRRAVDAMQRALGE
jgi:integrase